MPERDVLTSAPPGDALVAYAVVDRPEAGLLRRLAGLEVVLSLNAGVEHLLASGEVPDGEHVVFASNRYGSKPGSTNLFVARWVD